MGLLFLNAFKGLKSKKVQMIGIIFCIILSTSIYTAMNTALDRMEDRYHNYLKEQNVEDFSFVPNIDYSKDYTKEEVQNLIENELKDIPKEQMELVIKYQMTLGMGSIPNIDKLYEAVDYIFNNNGANDKKLEEKIEETKAKYDFKYTKQLAKVTTEEKLLHKAMIYDKNMNIDIPYLVEGRMPENDSEITVLPKFAEINNIRLGDKYKIGEKEYDVVGFAYSPDHIFPLISINRPIFNEKTDNIIYMTNSTFEEFDGVKESSYIAAFNDKDKTFDFETLFEMFKDDKNITLSPLAAMKILRVNSLEAEIKTDRLFAKYFLYLLLAISVFVIIVITKKRIEDERLQIGVLKSLGYKSFGIAISYLVYPIVGSIVGGAIGFVIGVPAHEILTKLYVGYFNLPIANFVINYKYLYESVIVPIVVLSILAFLIAIFMLRKKPLDLLKEGSNLKVNIFSRFVTFITKGLPFKMRFKLSLASRSLGKLFIVTLTSFCTGLLIVLILIGLNMFSSMIDKTFEGLNFDNMVSYQQAIKDESNEFVSDKEDLIYNTTFELDRVKKVNGDEVTIDKESVSNSFITINKNESQSDENNKENEDKENERFSISISGIDENPNFIKLYDINDNELQNKLVSDNDIIINKNIAELANVDINDTLILLNSDKEYEFKVVAIQDAFMGNQAYVRRDYISNLFEEKLAFNTKYSNEEKYSKVSTISNEEMNKITNIFSISDLRENMEKQMQSSNGSIYFVISFASVLALVIILVIANIIVEENKKTISLMKVMGYKNKVISQIVLNIYTPFVIIAYIASIPAMKEILKFIVKQLTSDMELAIPIEFSITKAIIGLVGLLIGYYIAIFVSRRTLNKVPLSVALKRE